MKFGDRRPQTINFLAEFSLGTISLETDITVENAIDIITLNEIMITKSLCVYRSMEIFSNHKKYINIVKNNIITNRVTSVDMPMRH